MAELPFDQELDREHAEAWRRRQLWLEEQSRRHARRATIKSELRRGAGVVARGRRGANDEPLTERITVTATPSERARLQSLADELRVSVPALLRACALAYERRLEGRL